MNANTLFFVRGTNNGECLESEVFLTHEKAKERMTELYNDALTWGMDYDKGETALYDWSFTVAFEGGWLCYDIQELPNPGVMVPLPDGRSLHASSKDDPDYPGIKICVLDKDMKPEDAMGAAWMEYNVARDDYSDNQKLRLLGWNASEDEPAVNMSYDTGEFEDDDRIVLSKNSAESINQVISEYITMLLFASDEATTKSERDSLLAKVEDVKAKKIKTN